MKTNATEELSNFGELLKPNAAKDRFLLISLFISLFEYFKDMIIDKVKYFWVEGFSDDKLIVSSKYKKEVLTKDKSVLYASLKWLKEIEAIEEVDIDLFTDIKNYRNKLTHEMLDIVFEGNYIEFANYYSKLINLIIKIDRWWVLNIELPTSCNENVHQIEEDKVITRSEMLIRLLTDLLAGDEDKAMEYYNEYLKYKT